MYQDMIREGLTNTNLIAFFTNVQRVNNWSPAEIKAALMGSGAVKQKEGEL